MSGVTGVSGGSRAARGHGPPNGLRGGMNGGNRLCHCQTVTVQRENTSAKSATTPEHYFYQVCYRHVRWKTVEIDWVSFRQSESVEKTRKRDTDVAIQSRVMLVQSFSTVADLDIIKVHK